MDKIQEIVFQDNGSKLATLRCDVCKNFLSVSPILHNSALGSICGRQCCAEIAKSEGTNYRQLAYETLAKYLKFPCMNKNNGCYEQLSWGKIGNHEKVCTFDTFNCPFSTDRFEQLENKICPWTGKTSTLLHEHMKKEHQAPHKFENYVELKLCEDQDKNQLFFSTIHESIIILLVITENQTFRLKVWSDSGIWRRIMYKIRVGSIGKLNKPYPKMRRTELIHPSFFKSEVNYTWLKFEFDCIRELFDSAESVIIQFYFDGILTGPLCELEPLSRQTNSKTCSKCKSLFTHAYSLCESPNRHYTCYVCCRIHFEINNSHSCPVCHSLLRIKGKPVLEIQNFVILNSLITCFLCSKRIDCFSSHLYNRHTGVMSQLNKYYKLAFTTPPMRFFFVFDDHIFVLSLSLTEKYIKYTVQCFESNIIEFKFDLELRNCENSSNYAAMTYSNSCAPAYIDSKNIPDDAHSNSIPIEWLNKFISSKESIKIKLNLSRI